MEKKTNSTNELLEQVIFRLNEILQNQLSIESQTETIKEFEEEIKEIKRELAEQEDILQTLKIYIIPLLFVLCFLVAFISYKMKGL